MHCAGQRCKALSSDKYDLTKHPNYPLTADFDKKNWFDIEKYLNRKLVLHPDDEYEVFVDDESKQPSCGVT